MVAPRVRYDSALAWLFYVLMCFVFVDAGAAAVAGNNPT